MEARGGSDANYVLGHSDRELERLRVQAALIDPITRQFLVDAGIAPGMRVLDIGCGAGDVSLLIADLVGPSGEVVGVDRSPVAIASARERASKRSLSQVSFVECELASMSFERTFDAAVGRYVLCFQPDPSMVLRTIARIVRPDGVIVFHEPDRSLMRSQPPMPTYDRACGWVTETYLQSGVDVHVGAKLYGVYLAAGLQAPTMRLHAIIGGANARDVAKLDADQAIILSAEIERLGIATERELDAATLTDRILAELAATKGVIIGRGEIGAWSRV